MEPVSFPGDGELLEGEHSTYLVKALLPDLDLIEYDVDADYEGPGPHYHERHADAFYVLEGEFEFRVGDETVRAPAGTSVVVPPGVVHAFTNAGPGRARLLNVHAPELRFVEFLRATLRGENVDPLDYDIHAAE